MMEAAIQAAGAGGSGLRGPGPITDWGCGGNARQCDRRRLLALMNLTGIAI